MLPKVTGQSLHTSSNPMMHPIYYENPPISCNPGPTATAGSMIWCGRYRSRLVRRVTGRRTWCLLPPTGSLSFLHTHNVTSYRVARNRNSSAGILSNRATHLRFLSLRFVKRICLWEADDPAGCRGLGGRRWLKITLIDLLRCQFLRENVAFVIAILPRNAADIYQRADCRFQGKHRATWHIYIPAYT